MSETLSQLNGQQQEQIKDWLNKMNLLRCKSCQFSNFAPPTVIVTLAGEKGPSEHNIFMVPLSCPHCGYTVLFNAKTMGVI
jgi:predicted nucleic-acid-binding Zn-ribbon protein